jgi:hypothetical protein
MLVTIEPSLAAALPHQSKHRVDRWRCDVDEARKRPDGGDEGIDFHGSATFEILQYRHFVADDRTNSAQSPRDRLKTPWAPKGNWALVEVVMSERESRQG